MNTYIIKTGIINAARKARREVDRAKADMIWAESTGNAQRIEQAREQLSVAKAAEIDILAPITEIIKEHQGRARERLMSARQLLDTLDKVEDHLNIRHVHMRDIRIRADPNAQTFPAAYRYIPESTHFDATYTASGWAVTGIYRGRTNSPQHAVDIELTDEARAAILYRAAHIAY